MGYRVGGIVLVVGACSLNVYRPPPDAALDDAGTVDAPSGAACVSAASAGRDHTCALRTDGTVWCWGSNEFGQLGDDTLIDRLVPVQVQNLVDIIAIKSGGSHSCALTSGHTVSCWGNNTSGQLGDGSLVDSKKPVPVVNLPGVRGLALGASHSCARMDDGSVTCWGQNGSGQLGDATVTSRSTHRGVSGPTGVTALVAGAETMCAVDGEQQLWCWGDNDAGQLGDGTPNQRNAPYQVTMPDAADVAGVALGDSFTCAITSAGGRSCFGSNQFRQLGVNAGGGAREPQPIDASVKASAIAGGARFACIIEDDDRHRVWCWGDNDDDQLGSTSDVHPFPTLTGQDDVIEIAAGKDHLCTLSSDKRLTCSGDNHRGQLGDGRRTTQVVPSPVRDLADVRSISSGAHHTCAVLGGGTVRCWGDNASGQLGDGSLVASTTPVQVVGVTGATQVVTGSAHTCALVDDGVVCWGNNDRGQLGDDSKSQRGIARPVIAVDGASLLTGVTRLAASGTHTCALAGGGVVCWGAFPSSSIAETMRPATVSADLAGVLDIATGEGHACAITSSRGVKCWGANTAGELGAGQGPGTPPSNPQPRDVAGLGDVDQLVAHGKFTCAHVMTDDTVRCWGAGDLGQLGNADNDDTIVPQQVMQLAGAGKLAAGEAHACAITPQGTVACWGSSELGQLGNGRYSNRAVAVDVPGLSGVVDIDGGDQHTCAVLGDGTVACWGDDRRGELGDGILISRGPAEPRIPCP